MFGIITVIPYNHSLPTQCHFRHYPLQFRKSNQKLPFHIIETKTPVKLTLKFHFYEMENRHFMIWGLIVHLWRVSDLWSSSVHFCLTCTCKELCPQLLFSKYNSNILYRSDQQHSLYGLAWPFWPNIYS